MGTVGNTAVEENFGRMCGCRRSRLKLRREDVAKLADVSVDDIVMLEKGKLSEFPRGVLQRVVQALQFKGKKKRRAYRSLNAIAPSSSAQPARRRVISHQRFSPQFASAR